MITQIQTVEELKSSFVQIVLNKQNKITKVNDTGVLNAIAYGVAKIAQKHLKEIAVLESHIFPDYAVGQYLDSISYSVGSRYGKKQSSTYVLVFAEAGTVYDPATHIFKSQDGIDFKPEKAYTVGELGFGYVKVRSVITGVECNVPALSINSVYPTPNGHQYCYNEYEARFGSNQEEDDSFRRRIKESQNQFARNTIAMFEQIFMKINENIIKVYFGGVNNGKIIFKVLTENGVDLTSEEINDLEIRSDKYMSITENRITGYNLKSFEIRNIDWQPIDISMRIILDDSFNVDDVRRNIQIRLNKYIDYRTLPTNKKIEWDNLLEIVKRTQGVKYVYDSYFYPNSDIQLDMFKLPRIRGFRMLDKDGNVIRDFQNILNPIYYPNDMDSLAQMTILKGI